MHIAGLSVESSHPTGPCDTHGQLCSKIWGPPSSCRGLSQIWGTSLEWGSPSLQLHGTAPRNTHGQLHFWVRDPSCCGVSPRSVTRSYCSAQNGELLPHSCPRVLPAGSVLPSFTCPCRALLQQPDRVGAHAGPLHLHAVPLLHCLAGGDDSAHRGAPQEPSTSWAHGHRRGYGLGKGAMGDPRCSL